MMQEKERIDNAETTTSDNDADGDETTTSAWNATTTPQKSPSTTSIATTMRSSVETVIEIEPRPQEHPTSHFRGAIQ